MRSPARTTFGAIFQTEVLLNSKRIAPYAMAILFGANAWLWQAKGPAVYYGWATNSEFVIVRIFAVFSFMTLPLFTALIMGDPVIRDFRTGIDPLIFSKPVSRATYLLGKFFGNFFVLVCCQMAFLLMLLMLQSFPTPQMVVQPARLVPHLKHFLLLVVISHLVLAAFYFTVGTLTRNAKIVYGLGVSFYPIYITYQAVLLKSLPMRWRIALDPLLMNWPDLAAKGHNGKWINAEAINQLAFSYNSDVAANRALMTLIAAVCLAILYARFAITERPRNVEKFSTLNLAAGNGRVYHDSESFQASGSNEYEKLESHEEVTISGVPLPEVIRADVGFQASLKKLGAALGVEFRLLRAERSLVVLMPLAVFFSILELAFYKVAPEVSYSAAYASSTAKALLLFLLGMAVFYTGEAMHRDREVRIESVLWSLPVPNSVLLLSKFLATLLLTFSLTVLIGLTAIAVQILKGDTPVDISAYLTTYSVVLLPSIIFMAGASLSLNVLLRDKYLAYAVSIATCAGLFYLYGIGYNHWLYNPVLYELWTPSDVVNGGSRLTRILTHRIYCLALSALFLALAHLFFGRKSTKVLTAHGRPSGTGWTILLATVSALVAVISGLIVTWN